MVARACLDILRARHARREESLDWRLPEPIVSRTDELDPEHQALLADSVGLALLVVLDTLAPAERLAFVLHDTFAVPFEEIAPIVGRSPTAAPSWRRVDTRLRSLASPSVAAGSSPST
jgi:DNA-directed RNA polymerase specialized sigma24 family protein